mgnify:CR=1 FL=1
MFSLIIFWWTGSSPNSLSGIFKKTGSDKSFNPAVVSSALFLVNKLSEVYSTLKDKNNPTELKIELGSLKSINIYFSGNEGFHVYVFNSQFQNLGSKERSELVDYIMFHGAIPETFGMKKFKPNRLLFPDFDEKGWNGRFSKQVYGSKSKRSKIISELHKHLCITNEKL